MDGVAHFEIAVDDKEKAKAFYAGVFGWQIMDMPFQTNGGTTNYTIAMTTEVDQQTQMPLAPGAINGAIIERTDQLRAPIITINVDSVDDALGKVKAAGGSVVQGRQEVPGMGALSLFTDPEGRMMGLWRAKS